MKRSIALAVMLFVLIGVGVAVAAHHEATVDKGKTLFNDPKLGTTEKSCNDCHPGGKGVEKGAGKKDLETMINTCVTQALKGKALDPKSVEMQSIVMYINSLGGAKKGGAKKAPVGC